MEEEVVQQELLRLFQWVGPTKHYREPVDNEEMFQHSILSQKIQGIRKHVSAIFVAENFFYLYSELECKKLPGNSYK